MTKNVIIVKLDWALPPPFHISWAIYNIKTKKYLREGYRTRKEAVADAKKRKYNICLYSLTGVRI